MLIWRGLGFLVVVITLSCLAASEWISEALTQDPHYYQTHTSPMVVGFLLAAILTRILSKRLATQKQKGLIDQQTGQEVRVKPQHALFFIPLAYWGLLLLGCAVLAFLFK